MWSLIWFSLVRNSPEEDYMISVEEKQYLKQFNDYNVRTKVYLIFYKVVFSSTLTILIRNCWKGILSLE